MWCSNSGRVVPVNTQPTLVRQRSARLYKRIADGHGSELEAVTRTRPFVDFNLANFELGFGPTYKIKLTNLRWKLVTFFNEWLR